MIGVIGRVRHDMADPAQSFEQAARLWAVTPLAGRVDKADGETKRVHGGVDFDPLSSKLCFDCRAMVRSPLECPIA